MKQTNFKRTFICLAMLTLVCVIFLASTFTSHADEPLFDHVELKVGDTIGLVYYTNYTYSGTNSNPNVYLRYKIGNRTAETEVPAYPNDGTCVFVLNDIYPHELGQEITATIVLKNANGTKTDIATSTGISVKTELLKMLSDPTQSQNYKFASNLLQYGEQTRLYRNAYVTDSSMRDEKSILDFDTNIYTNYNPDSIYVMYNRNPAGLGMSASNIRMASIGVSYHDTNRFVITVKTPSGGSVNMGAITLYINGKAYSGSNFTKIDNTTYEVQSDPINAFAIPNAVNFELHVNGLPVQQATYSVADYCYQLEQTTEQRSLAQNYAKSLLVYGQAAAAAYKDNRVVAMQLNTAPGNITIANTNAQQPTGGSATVWYSNGSTGTVTPIWDAVAGITDDTYTVTRTTIGRYQDTQSGKTYTVTSHVKLENPITSMEAWADPNAYSPSTYAATYQPDVNTCGALVRCTWSNQYKSVRKPDSITQVSIPTLTEYTTLTCVVSYTNPQKSDNTKKCNVTLLYKNPIASLTISDSLVSFDDNDFNSTAMPDATTYCLKFSDGQATTYYNTAATNTLGTFGWKAASYTGTATSGSISAGTGLTTTGTFTGKSMPSVTLKTGCTHTVGAQCTCSAAKTTSPTAAAVVKSATCRLDFLNPEKYITITKAPTATINDTTAPTSANGKLTNGQTTVTLANGKTYLASTATYAASSGHTSTDYKVSVTVTASYNNLKNANGQACTVSIDLLNPIVSVSQTAVPTVNAANYANAGVTLSPSTAVLNGTLTATYQNGTTMKVNVTNFIVEGQGQSNTCYVANITDTTETTTKRTTACTSSSMNSAYSGALVAQHVDSRANAPQTAKDCYYGVNVKNTATGFKGENRTQSTDNYTMTSSTPATITPTGNLLVTLTNGREKSITPTYSTISKVTAATEYEDRYPTATYKSSNGSTITTEAKTRVINPVTSVTRYTDPTPITVSSTSAVAASSVSGGKVTVTYTNGQSTTNVSPNSYTVSGAQITGSTLIQRFAITANFVTSYSGTKTCTLYLILKNPSKSASAANPSSKQLTSSTSGLTVSGTTVTITYNNNTTSTATSAQWGTLYPTGTASKTNTPSSYGSSVTSGSQSYSQTYTVAASSTVERYVNGSATTESVAAATYTISVTQSWTNPVTKVVANSASATVTDGKSSGSVTPTGSITATFSSGRVKDYTSNSSLSWSTVTTVTDASPSVTRKTTATFCGVKSNEINCVVYNPPKSLGVATNQCRLTGAGEHAAGWSHILTYKNGQQTTVNGKVTLSNASSGLTVSNNGTTTVKVKYTGSKSDATASRSISYTCPTNGNTVTHSDTLIVVNVPYAKSSYSSSVSSTQSNNFPYYSTSTSSTVTPSISSRIYGANGNAIKSDATLTAPSGSLKNVTSCYLYKNQSTSTNTDTWSSSCAVALLYSYTLPASYSTSNTAYEVGLTVSTYSYNPITSYTFSDKSMNYTKGSAYGIRADFFTVTIQRIAIYNNGTTYTQSGTTYDWTPSSSTVFRWGLSTSNSSTYTWSSSSWSYKSSLSSSFSSFNSSDNFKYALYSSVIERTNLVGTGAKAWDVAYNKSGFKCYAYVGIKFNSSYTIGGESCSKEKMAPGGDYVTKFYRINASASDVL